MKHKLLRKTFGHSFNVQQTASASWDSAKNFLHGCSLRSIMASTSAWRHKHTICCAPLNYLSASPLACMHSSSGVNVLSICKTSAPLSPSSSAHSCLHSP